MDTSTQSFISSQQPRFRDELFEFLSIPSISTLPKYRPDIHRAAEFVAVHLREAGLENIEVIPTKGHPLVYAEWLHAPNKPTVLCYGHYDVQPADPLELWESPPFEPTVRGGNVYARGASDDKGQMYTHIKAVEALCATHGQLPVNLKFLIEGEEEVGGESISAFVPTHREKLAAEVALVSDTSMYAPGTPTLCIGLRGLVYMEWEARGSVRDLHSGLYGGAVPNAVFGLVELLAQCKDPSSRVQIPGFYDAVTPPSSEEKQSWEALPFDEKEFLDAEVGSGCLTGEPGYSVFERIWARPTFEVHGIAGGFTGPGGKTVIPAQATAKVSLRLVPEQDPERLVVAAREFVRTHSPSGIDVEIRLLHAAPATLVKSNHPAIQTAARALEEVFGSATVFIRSGGSIPIVGEFSEYLGIPSVLMGFGLPDDGLHSPNEKFSLENYEKGILAVAHFFDLLGRQS